MRQIIENRLDEIKKLNGGFTKASMRWCNLNVDIDGKSYHLSEISDDLWKSIDNEKLLNIFERVIRRHYSQM
jgi:hypothetical protein